MGEKSCWDLNLSPATLDQLTLFLQAFSYDPLFCDNKNYDPTVTREYALSRISAESLDVSKSLNVAGKDENIIRINKELITLTLQNLLQECVREAGLPQGIFHVTGRFWYPPNGFMGWHTNYLYPGYRLYCTHSAEDYRSFFRYRCPETGQIVTEREQGGWQARIFLIDRERPLWHCVYSETERISIGCNLEVGTNYSADWERLGGTV